MSAAAYSCRGAWDGDCAVNNAASEKRAALATTTRAAAPELCRMRGLVLDVSRVVQLESHLCRPLAGLSSQGGCMADLFMLGRLIFGGYFVYSGVNHFLNVQTMAQYAGAKGVPLPEVAVLGTGMLLLAGGISILFGLLPRIGLACIIVFFVGVTPMMHNFWTAT